MSHLHSRGSPTKGSLGGPEVAKLATDPCLLTGPLAEHEDREIQQRPTKKLVATYPLSYRGSLVLRMGRNLQLARW